MVHAGRHARNRGAYVAAGIALALGPAARAQPPNDSHSARPASAPAQQAPANSGQPSDLPAVKNAVERVAGALEAKNRYDQSAKGQQDAHDAAQAAKEAACWAGWMLVAAVVETLVTGAGVVLVWRTLRHVRDTATETKNTATAAKDTLDHAKIAAQQQLRAYVTFEKIEINWASDSTGTVQAFWTNTGHTPTQRGIARVALRIETTELPGDFNYPDVDSEPASSISLGGGQTQSAFTLSRIKLSDIERIEPGIYFINAWGWIEYNDVFENTKRHRTEFATALHVLGGVTGNKQIVWEGRGPFNGADGDCYRQPTT
jgi:hypothetical protein